MGIRRILTALFLCMMVLIVHAQVNYEPKWKLIDSLIQKKGLTQSALEEVNKLSVVARQDRNDPQLIKTLVYRLSLEQSRTDSGLLFAIGDLETELAKGTGRQPGRSILQCMLAGLYANYLRQNVYVIRNRTNTTGFVKTDVATWTIDDLLQKTRDLYLGALADEELLWTVPLKDYSPIVIKGNASAFRPTLFDLLAHAALDYFKTSDVFTGKPAEDPLSGRRQARHLFERLIRRHQGDKTPDALIDVEIERTGFEHQLGDADNKEELYVQALEQIMKQFGMIPAATEAWYLRAQQYANQQGVAEDQRDTLGNRKAVAICEQVVLQKDSSTGRDHCMNLLYELQLKELSMTTEKANIPNRPFRVLVRWRNFPRLYLRLIRIGPGNESRDKTYDSLFWKGLLQIPAIRSWSQDLPDTRDYTAHEVEIAVGSLPPGNYALIGSSSADWRLSEAAMCLQDLAVSRISWINRDNDYYVLDRESGQPLPGATVQVWTRSGNMNKLSKGGSFTTDDHGFVRLPKEEKPSNRFYGSTLLEVTIPGDHYFPKDAMIRPLRYPETNIGVVEDPASYEAKHTQGYLFTDRSIYRPGQTVYFKGIELTEDARTHVSKLRTGVPVKLVLLNANQQRTDSLELTTNEFGSFQGMFRLPEHSLNGNFSIQQDDSRGTADFSVEEYKRPKFYVDYEKLTGSYRVGDSIRVTGLARPVREMGSTGQRSSTASRGGRDFIIPGCSGAGLFLIARPRSSMGRSGRTARGSLRSLFMRCPTSR